MPEFNLVGPSYVATMGNSDCERTMNFYPEVVESGLGKGKVSLESCPGTEVANFFPTRSGTGGSYSRINHVYVDNERMWIVACGALYEWVNGAPVFKAELNNGGVCPDNVAISMSSNGIELLICASDFGTVGKGVFLYNIKNETISCQTADTHPDTYLSTQCSFLDGYFILFSPVDPAGPSWSQKFYISGIYDGAHWDSLDFASAEGNPDRVIAIIVDHCELWLFGRQTTEIFVNTGNADFPFQRANTAVFDFGIMSFRSLAKLDNSLFFLGGDSRGTHIVYRTRGYQVERVSNHAVEASLATGDYDLETCYAYSYTEAGHSFYVLTVHGGRANWVYDTVSGLWHERGAWNETLGDFIALPFVSHGFFKGEHYICGPEAESIAPAGASNPKGVLYRQSVNLPSRAGDPIRRARVTPHMSSEQAWQFYYALQMDVECKSATPVTPAIVLDWSDDGGKTWSNTHTVTLPATGTPKAQQFRAIWRRLGRGRDRVFRFYVESQVRWSFINGYLKYNIGSGI